MRAYWRLGACLAMAGRVAMGGVVVAMAVNTIGCVAEEKRDDRDDDDDEDGGGLSVGGGGEGRQGQSCSGGEVSCAGSDIIDVCEEGTYQSYSCGEACSSMGYASNGCGDSTCQCGEPTNGQCVNGVLGLCACLELAGEPACTDEQLQAWYPACHQGDPDVAPVVTCFANYVSGDSIDCYAAAEACL